MSFLKAPEAAPDVRTLFFGWHNSCAVDFANVLLTGINKVPEEAEVFVKGLEARKTWHRGRQYIIPVPVAFVDDDFDARLADSGFMRMGANKSHVMYHKVRD